MVHDGYVVGLGGNAFKKMETHIFKNPQATFIWWPLPGVCKNVYRSFVTVEVENKPNDFQ